MKYALHKHTQRLRKVGFFLLGSSVIFSLSRFSNFFNQPNSSIFVFLLNFNFVSWFPWFSGVVLSESGFATTFYAGGFRRFISSCFKTVDETGLGFSDRGRGRWRRRWWWWRLLDWFNGDDGNGKWLIWWWCWIWWIHELWKKWRVWVCEINEWLWIEREEFFLQCGASIWITFSGLLAVRKINYVFFSFSFYKFSENTKNVLSQRLV